MLLAACFIFRAMNIERLTSSNFSQNAVNLGAQRNWPGCILIKIRKYNEEFQPAIWVDIRVRSSKKKRNVICDSFKEHYPMLGVKYAEGWTTSPRIQPSRRTSYPSSSISTDTICKLQNYSFSNFKKKSVALQANPVHS